MNYDRDGFSCVNIPSHCVGSPCRCNPSLVLRPLLRFGTAWRCRRAAAGKVGRLGSEAMNGRERVPRGRHGGGVRRAALPARAASVSLSDCYKLNVGLLRAGVNAPTGAHRTPGVCCTDLFDLKLCVFLVEHPVIGQNSFARFLGDF